MLEEPIPAWHRTFLIWPQSVKLPHAKERAHHERGDKTQLCASKSSDISAKDATHAGSFPFAAAREDFIQTLYQVMERVL